MTDPEVRVDTRVEPDFVEDSNVPAEEASQVDSREGTQESTEFVPDSFESRFDPLNPPDEDPGPVQE